MRLSKDDYYLNIAEAVLACSTCLRRKYGAVIVKDDEIIECVGIHAEMNAIISASRRDMIGATLYLASHEADGNIIQGTSPCTICERLIRTLA